MALSGPKLVLQARQHGTGAFTLCRPIVIFDGAPGTTCGTTVHTLPGTPGHFQAGFPQVTCMSRRCELGVVLGLFRLTSEKPVVRTHLRPRRFPQLDGLFENTNGRPGDYSREPPVHAFYEESVPSGHGRIPSGHPGTPRRRQAHVGTGVTPFLLWAWLPCSLKSG